MSFESSKIITYPDIDFKQEYRIDENGTIWSPWRGWSVMHQNKNRCGYMEIYLYTANKGRKCFKVHRLVMETFNPVGNSHGLQVNHIDGNKVNNNLENLEWCTRSENLKHAFKLGLESVDGEKNPSHKLTEKDVIEICERLNKKEMLSSIAKDFNVSKGCTAHIRKKITWKNISEKYSFN